MNIWPLFDPGFDELGPRFTEADCLCLVTPPDEFGNRDLIEDSACPLHGALDAGDTGEDAARDLRDAA